MLVPLATACVEDPPVPVTGEAVIRSQFIPVDSVNKLTLRQSLIDGQILFVSDDLDYIDSLEDAGVPGDYTEERLVLNTRLDSLEEIKSSLSSSVSQLSRGIITLDFLTALESEEQITYDFPREFYGLPLPGNAGEVTFLIKYGTYQEQATVSFQVETLFEERVVRQRGYSLGLTDYSFDSVKVQCSADTCNTDEILYTFYF